jgi:hypothetical protein
MTNDEILRTPEEFDSLFAKVKQKPDLFVWNIARAAYRALYYKERGKPDKIYFDDKERYDLNCKIEQLESQLAQRDRGNRSLKQEIVTLRQTLDQDRINWRSLNNDQLIIIRDLRSKITDLEAEQTIFRSGK